MVSGQVKAGTKLSNKSNCSTTFVNRKETSNCFFPIPTYIHPRLGLPYKVYFITLLTIKYSDRFYKRQFEVLG